MASFARARYFGAMGLRLTGVVWVLLAVVPVEARPQDPGIFGTWEVETPEGPMTLVVRPDSTAAFGEESVRWRVTSDTIFIQFGDEWVGYNFQLQDDSLTIWGGDLEDPVLLKRVGAPQAVPNVTLSVAVTAIRREAATRRC